MLPLSYILLIIDKPDTNLSCHSVMSRIKIKDERPDQRHQQHQKYTIINIGLESPFFEILQNWFFENFILYALFVGFQMGGCLVFHIFSKSCSLYCGQELQSFHTPMYFHASTKFRPVTNFHLIAP